MITAFICNIEIDRGSLNKLKEDWNAGAKPIKTPRREDSNSYYASDAKDRVDNFPTPMLPYIYGINARKDSVIPTRFYKLIDKKIFNIEIKWVDILTVSPDLIKSEEIPAQITLVTDITGPFKEIKDKINKLSRHNKIYEVIEKLNLWLSGNIRYLCLFWLSQKRLLFYDIFGEFHSRHGFLHRHCPDETWLLGAAVRAEYKHFSESLLSFLFYDFNFITIS